ncbi:MAG: 4-(cytidine 5'-diphospho)-2-C-methyl-D-erythritol kinase [Verrucomicrobiota bacterium]
MVAVFSPAKINLFLAVTGKRDDGFHDLVSLAAPLAHGDDLSVEIISSESDELQCSDPNTPLDESNLVLQAAREFRVETGISAHFRFRLEKRIPLGGGFGGGSSNAVAAIKAMNQLVDRPLDKGRMHLLASGIGSDCPLFLSGDPVIMRGRGERIEERSDLRPLLADWKIALFDPGFHASTALLFQSLANEAEYVPAERAESDLSSLIKNLEEGSLAGPLTNSFSRPLRAKYFFYNTLFDEFEELGISSYGITGSGSGCFALYREKREFDALSGLEKRLFGRKGFMIETEFLTSEDSQR